jgi:hypothetical protein
MNGAKGHLVSLLSFVGASLHVCWLAVVQKGKERVTYVDAHMLPTNGVREAPDWLYLLNSDIQPCFPPRSLSRGGIILSAVFHMLILLA